MLLFTIGSMSEIKQNALRRALKICGFEATVEAVEVDSGVNIQPCGNLETAQGAITRAEGARAARPAPTRIGIENGIHRSNNDSGWSDWAVIIMITPDGQTHRIDSEEVEIPERYVEVAESTGFDNTTVGKVLAQRYGCDANDPHKYLSREKTNREEILNQALIVLFMEHLTPKMVYPIKVRGVRRFLPIREVAPGVRVALFNILGDWELTEAPASNFQRWFRPTLRRCSCLEGKAIALLHVMHAKRPTDGRGSQIAQALYERAHHWHHRQKHHDGWGTDAVPRSRWCRQAARSTSPWLMTSLKRRDLSPFSIWFVRLKARLRDRWPFSPKAKRSPWWSLWSPSALRIGTRHWNARLNKGVRFIYLALSVAPNSILRINFFNNQARHPYLNFPKRTPSHH